MQIILLLLLKHMETKVILKQKLLMLAKTPSGILVPYVIILPSPFVIIITKAVIVQTTTVSINGSNKATNPSDAGYFVFTAECAIAAEPTPASFENAAL